MLRGGPSISEVVRRLCIRDLGLRDYAEVLQLQMALLEGKCQGQTLDYLLLVEHPPVYTLGRGGNEGHLISRGSVPVYRVSRGGDVTFHGPGQLVGYPILDLRFQGRDVHLYLRRLEAVLIDSLKAWGLQAERHPGLTGVWVEKKKIASVGVGIRRWVSFHGFALNVDPDLTFFEGIIPCGLPGVRMTSMAALLGEGVSMDQVKEAVKKSFIHHFGYPRVGEGLGFPEA